MESKPADRSLSSPDEADSQSRKRIDQAFGGRKPFGATGADSTLTDDQAFAELRRRQLNRSR
jgi:hypothetical protein